MNNEVWKKWYILAKKYFEVNGNLEVPMRFKTINGYEYDENGSNLGVWIRNQRTIYNNKKMSEKEKSLLEKIGMRFEINFWFNDWLEKYELVRKYFEVNGNLNIPIHFKTVNGYEYAENGFNLYFWFYKQKRRYNGMDKPSLEEKQRELLEKLPIDLEHTYFTFL